MTWQTFLPQRWENLLERIKLCWTKSWHHDMEKSLSTLLGIDRSPVVPLTKGENAKLSLLFGWTSCWPITRAASDLKLHYDHIDGLVQERHDSSALAMELCLSCTNHRYDVTVMVATIWTWLLTVYAKIAGPQPQAGNRGCGLAIWHICRSCRTGNIL